MSLTLQSMLYVYIYIYFMFFDNDLSVPSLHLTLFIISSQVGHLVALVKHVSFLLLYFKLFDDEA